MDAANIPNQLGKTPHAFRLPDVFEEPNTKPRLVVHNVAARTPQHMTIGFSSHALSIVLSGQKHLLANDSRLHLQSGQSLLYAASAEFITWDSPDYTSYLVFFSPAELAEFLHTNNVDVLQRETQDCHFSFSAHASLVARVTALEKLETEFGSQSEKMRKNALHSVLLELLEANGPQIFQCLMKINAASDTSKLKSILQRHWREKLSIDDLATKANMSRSSFCRRIKQIYGIAPSEWITERRMAEAWHLLVFSNARPSDVAHALGYTSHSAFSQAFRKHFGRSPSDADLSGLQ